ncbi:hypothetical protein A0256_01700 [Mucilaginibacter sp. PAMC 26640]|nr:hypothetical protein A0256_01700 [Mucilaginibacter sp. PAMC 26640]
MPENEQNTPQEAGKEAASYGKYMGVAFQMIVIIGVFTFAGYKIDEATGHQTKWVTAVLSLFGVFAALFLIIRSVRN